MKTIALIDDTQANLTLLWHWVKSIPGYQAASFLDPIEALDWCLNNQPELIIIDTINAQMDSLGFIEQLRKKFPKDEIPVLIITESDQLDKRHKALQAGANDYLNKPVDKTEFSFRTDTLLTLRHCHKKLSDKTSWLDAEISAATHKILEREQEIIYRLVKSAEYRDPETEGHIKRISHYTRHIAANLGLALSEQVLISEAAAMHDIGKVGVPDAILLKPGKLDETEFRAMQEHAQIGYDILAASNSELLQAGATIALTHHEKFDGTGYPNSLKGDEIHLYGRITAVADVFDALTSARPYKKAWPIKGAILFLKENTGHHFDPACVQALLQHWDNVLAIKERFQD